MTEPDRPLAEPRAGDEDAAPGRAHSSGSGSPVPAGDEQADVVAGGSSE